MNIDVDLRRDIFNGTVNVGRRRRATQQIANELVNDAEALPDAIPVRRISKQSLRGICSQSL